MKRAAVHIDCFWLHAFGNIPEHDIHILWREVGEEFHRAEPEELAHHIDFNVNGSNCLLAGEVEVRLVLIEEIGDVSDGVLLFDLEVGNLLTEARPREVLIFGSEGNPDALSCGVVVIQKEKAGGGIFAERWHSYTVQRTKNARGCDMSAFIKNKSIEFKTEIAFLMRGICKQVVIKKALYSAYNRVVISVTFYRKKRNCLLCEASKHD